MFLSELPYGKSRSETEECKKNDSHKMKTKQFLVLKTYGLVTSFWRSCDYFRHKNIYNLFYY